AGHDTTPGLVVACFYLPVGRLNGCAGSCIRPIMCARSLTRWLALGVCGRYISAEFPKSPSKSLRKPYERPPIRLSHAGSVEDLSGQPQGARKHQPVILPGR